MTKIKITEDKELKELILTRLKENQGYCPCSLLKNQDTICMCKDFRENVKLGACHCGLYIKYQD